MSAPNVRGFFDPVTATWTYVVWSATDAQKRCAIIDSVLDFDLHLPHIHCFCRCRY